MSERPDREESAQEREEGSASPRKEPRRISGLQRVCNIISAGLLCGALGAFAVSACGYAGVENTFEQLIGAAVGVGVYIVGYILFRILRRKK